MNLWKIVLVPLCIASVWSVDTLALPDGISRIGFECYVDKDTDTYGSDTGDSYFSDVACIDAEPPGSENNFDCDDSNKNINPDAEESWYDGVDNDCDGANDYDQDRDTYVLEKYDGFKGGTAPSGGDCDDTSPDVNPGALEIPGNGVDEDCDGFDHKQCWVDSDGDEYGDPDAPVACSDTDADVGNDQDCDDSNADVNPGALEISGDDIDQNCNGLDINPDTDSDGDTVLDGIEDRNHDNDPNNDDTDDDKIPDYLDTDDDGDSVPTKAEDPDGDGDPTNNDTDDDKRLNDLDDDDDGDSVPPKAEDPDGDGDPTNDNTDKDKRPNYLDDDDDGDGILTIREDPDGDGDPTNDDSDKDKIPDYLDTDSPGPKIFDNGFEAIPKGPDS